MNPLLPHHASKRLSRENNPATIYTSCTHIVVLPFIVGKAFVDT